MYIYVIQNGIIIIMRFYIIRVYNTILSSISVFFSPLSTLHLTLFISSKSVRWHSMFTTFTISPPSIATLLAQGARMRSWHTLSSTLSLRPLPFVIYSTILQNLGFKSFYNVSLVALKWELMQMGDLCDPCNGHHWSGKKVMFHHFMVLLRKCQCWAFEKVKVLIQSGYPPEIMTIIKDKDRPKHGSVTGSFVILPIISPQQK